MELEFDQNKVIYFWIIISRWKCHYLQNSAIEHIGGRENIPVAVLEIIDCHGHLAYGGKSWKFYM